MPFIGIPPFGQTVRTVTTITATASQTTFTPTGGYTVGYCDVYYNGIKLVGGTDFTASNGTTVVLTAGATSGAVVEIITYGSVTITDAVRRSGDTFAGAVAINSTLAAGNTTITGFANVTSTIQGGAGLTIAGAASGITTLSAGNTTITGSLTASANVNLDSGTFFVDGTNNRVGINNTAPTSALTVTGNAAFSNTVTIGGEYISPHMGFKNRIINGAMVIDQRNAGAAVTTANSFPVDRFKIEKNSDDTFSAQQDSSAPVGFTNSTKITITAADASIGSTQYFVIDQYIEGYNVADLNWGSANAKTVTLSFWVRSSLTGTFGGSLRNSAGDRNYAFTYSISAADTWEQKSVTIAGDTSGTWLTTNGVGIQLCFSLGAGSSRVATAGSWGSGVILGASGQTQVISTLNATFYITGVQLEKGSTATSFDYRPYGTELALCQRYFAKSYDINTAVGTATRNGYVDWNWQNLSNYGTVTIYLPVRMRAAPTSTNYNPDLTNTVGGRYWNGSAEVAFTGSMSGWTNYESNIRFNKDSTNSTNMLIHWTASAEL